MSLTQIETEIEIELDEDATPEAAEDAAGDAALNFAQRGEVFPFEGGHIEVAGRDEGMGFDQSTLITLALSFSAGVASGVVANAVYAVCGTAVRALTISGRRVRVTEKDIEQAIKTLITHAEDRKQGKT